LKLNIMQTVKRGDMTDLLPNGDVSSQLNDLSQEIYTTLADQFPVCMASDEFHFFPHFRKTPGGGTQWDDFSESAVQSFFAKVSRWRDRLEQMALQPLVIPLATDVELLSNVLMTLEEQLRLVEFHKVQPTFYLTILSIGLTQALEHSHDAFGLRIAALPEFLDSAMTNLRRVPAVFADLAAEMISKLQEWICLLPLNDDQRSLTIGAMRKFSHHVGRAEIALEFRLPIDLYARVADHHMGCRMGLDEIAWHLDREVNASARQLDEYANDICPGAPWQTVFQELPSPPSTDGDIAARYQDGIARLKKHCLENGFFGDDLLMGSHVEIQTIDEHLMPVRANAAYTMPPGHPPAGGVFYISPARRQSVPRDLMLLAAHETFPGHHLLDTVRWQLKQPLRRCLEFPLFYEGWASFGEEILFDTGFFKGSVDCLLMAKRRFWRAHRGRVELGIHSGRCSLDEGAKALADIGLVNHQQALAMVRRYALKPGYQLSYAIGRIKFHGLYEAYIERGHTPGQFVRAALSEGEVGFEHLAQRMFNSAVA
jgi:hypothetical protein